MIVLRRHLGLVVAAFVLVACSNSADSERGAPAGGPASGSLDAGTADARTVDAASGADGSTADAGPVDTSYLACMDSAGRVNPTLKECGRDADCTIQEQKTNCCGDILYVGVSQSSKAALAACEAAWDTRFPSCGCPKTQTVTEDGSINVDAESPSVRCEAGHCKTFTWKR